MYNTSFNKSKNSYKGNKLKYNRNSYNTEDYYNEDNRDQNVNYNYSFQNDYKSKKNNGYNSYKSQSGNENYYQQIHYNSNYQAKVELNEVKSELKEVKEVNEVKEKQIENLENHEQNSQCLLENCTKWRAQFKISKERILKYQAKGFFISNQVKSLLDTLEVIDKISEITDKTLLTLQEKSKFQENCVKLNFPLSEISEKNLFFIMTNVIIPVEILQGNEIAINVNAISHSKKIFLNDKRFFIDPALFIKSIYKKLYNHQCEFKKKLKVVSTSGLNIENHKFKFFTKLENFDNIGFEFNIKG